jgi:hypothetical protein
MEGGYGEELCSVPRGISYCEMTSDFPPKPAKGRAEADSAEQSRAEQSQKKNKQAGRQAVKQSTDRFKAGSGSQVSHFSQSETPKLMREIFCLP